MAVMMVIGLITMSIIMRTLGITDYGIYSAVGGVVTMFMLVMNTVSSAITRFVTVALGEGDSSRLKTTFGTSLLIMALFCLLIVLLTETLGLGYLRSRMVIPAGRMPAAEAVLHSSMLVLVVNLLSIPFTAVINAHEHMSAYAWISILEAVLKLLVAFGVWLSPANKLITYAWLLLAVAVIARVAYALYSASHFPEARMPFRASLSLAREMGGFAGWNFLSSGAYMLNTQGINQLMNLFFGVTMNAARGVADKVEQVVRQFATNIALALNPQLTKSYVGGSKDYAFDLAAKGSKYYFWVLWIISIPFFTDAQTILRLWIGEVPPEAALFTRLTLLCFLIDFTPGTVNILQQAHGHIGKYYLVTSAVAVLVFPITYFLYRAGAPAWAGYAVFAVVYSLKAIVMLLLVKKDLGFSIGEYFSRAVIPILWALIPSLILVGGTVALVPPLWWRFLLTAAVGAAASALGIWTGGLTQGEKGYIKSKFHRP